MSVSQRSHSHVYRGAVDVPAVVRGASVGFSVLVVGGLLAPMAVQVWAGLGLVWLPAVAVIAFAWAAGKACVVRETPVQGVLSAVTAYILVLPLVALGSGGIDAGQVSLTVLAAIAVGGCTAPLRQAFRARGTSRSRE